MGLVECCCSGGGPPAPLGHHYWKSLHFTEQRISLIDLTVLTHCIDLFCVGVGLATVERARRRCRGLQCKASMRQTLLQNLRDATGTRCFRHSNGRHRCGRPPSRASVCSVTLQRADVSLYCADSSDGKQHHLTDGFCRSGTLGYINDRVAARRLPLSVDQSAIGSQQQDSPRCTHAALSPEAKLLLTTMPRKVKTVAAPHGVALQRLQPSVRSAKTNKSPSADVAVPPQRCERQQQQGARLHPMCELLEIEAVPTPPGRANRGLPGALQKETTAPIAVFRSPLLLRDKTQYARVPRLRENLDSSALRS